MTAPRARRPPQALAGYSKRSLVEKLGIKQEFKIAIVSAPQGYAATLGRLPAGVTVKEKPEGPLDFVQFFCTQRQVLESAFRALRRRSNRTACFGSRGPKAHRK